MGLKKYIVFGIVILLISCTEPVVQEKINGVSFVAARDSISQKHVYPVVELNANYAAIMPFGFVRDLENPEIIFDNGKQWFGESKVGAAQYITELKKQNIKIMLKPHIWVRQGEFTGHIKMTNEEDWKQLEKSYSKYILEYAKLAEITNCELFCIGTELEQFVVNRPEYWHNLIEEIKNIYKGKLTYAANWDEFRRTPFWSDLDFIGIDAYFPVCDNKTPSVEECMEGWNQHKGAIEGQSRSHNRPVLFTEFGYRSVDFSGKEPWKSDRNMTSVNLDAQMNTTKALFDTFWNKRWFAGGFVWKWFHKHDDVGGLENNQFTPQNKPVEGLIQSIYMQQ